MIGYDKPDSLRELKMSNPPFKSCCVFCGRSDEPLTDDHIPPKCLFRKPRPACITVPACSRCNLGTSQDDEFLRNFLLTRADSSESEEANEQAEAMFRGLARQEQRGFLKSLLRRIGRLPLFGKSGMYYGTIPVFISDEERLDRIFQKLLCGLFYHETTQLCPPDVETVVKPVEFWQSMSSVEPDLSVLQQSAPRVIRQNAFEYRFVQGAEGGCESLWLLSFYGNLLYIGAMRTGGDEEPSPS